MNWLAHVFLSEPDIEHRLGNLLADLVRGAQRETMSAQFRRGADLHRAIDSFTDAHPIVRRSRARLSSQHRRFSGVLIDVFYDYFLASRWEQYANEPLTQFTQRFYEQARTSQPALPEEARGALERIIHHDLLGAYRRIDGVEESLRRLSLYLARRWRREFALHTSVAELREHETALAADFAEFFPALQQHVARIAASG